MAQYELVFTGGLADGFSLDQVKENVAKLFKASPAQVDQMFSGKAVVLRNRLDDVTAQKYKAVLHKNGAVCLIREMGAPEVNEPAPTAVSSAPVQPVVREPTPQAATTAAKPVKSSAPTGGLPVAGEKVDDILSEVDWDIAPVGSVMSEHHETLPLPEPDLSHLQLAPAGSDLGQKKKGPPPPAPDTSHIKLEEPRK
ncbi:conserved hypothetical protein [Hahella chejuensis KCTC 2396]|uniref:Uncharacterized protein n=1 Tax=Hahella chejuensis (strain KCTC 2396) TaxID=349521 RepID=Q2SQ46_HAHCH|nr:hypothetical protein [Hahella chejuensis]ABC27228.1 conserved hypothetical protein [Hahella chejuensis KCTC 2396]